MDDSTIEGNIRDTAISTYARGIAPSAADIIFCLFNGHREAAVHLNEVLKEGKNQPVEIRRRCHMELSSVSCKALLEGAYFDAKSKSCREFTGCGGVFPFNNLDACKSACA